MVAGRVEKIAMPLDRRGEAQRMLALQPFGEVGIAPFERLDDRHGAGCNPPPSRRGTMASCAARNGLAAVQTPIPSFPRKRESKGVSRLLWAPAFAGATN
jgi:hypothetical protein